VGYHSAKPRKLRELARFVVGEGGVDALRRSTESTASLRGRLLDVWGIGPETADAILLYALDRPAFVADAYALRLASRWGLLRPDATYDEVQALFMDNLPRDVALFNEFHALIVAHGKVLCRTHPRCHVCPLAETVLFEDGADWKCPRLFLKNRV
jgi:endonuclease-3 related protein